MVLYPTYFSIVITLRYFMNFCGSHHNIWRGSSRLHQNKEIIFSMTFLEFWCAEHKKQEVLWRVIQMMMDLQKFEQISISGRNRFWIFDYHHRKLQLKKASKNSSPRNNAWVDDKIQFVNLQFQVAYLSNSIMHNHLSTPYLAFRLPSIKLSILFFRLFKIFGNEEPAKMNLAWSG